MCNPSENLGTLALTYPEESRGSVLMVKCISKFDCQVPDYRHSHMVGAGVCQCQTTHMEDVVSDSYLLEQIFHPVSCTWAGRKASLSGPVQQMECCKQWIPQKWRGQTLPCTQQHHAHNTIHHNIHIHWNMAYQMLASKTHSPQMQHGPGPRRRTQQNSWSTLIFLTGCSPTHFVEISWPHPCPWRQQDVMET